MANLRLQNINVLDSRHIEAEFSEILSQNITAHQIHISTISESIPIPEILELLIDQNFLILTLQPLTPLTLYTIRFSYDGVFTSSNGNFHLLEDNKTNLGQFIGPLDPSNPFRNQLEVYLKDNILNLEPATAPIINNLVLDGFALFLARNLYDLRQLKNDNYLNFLVQDEQKTRGEGPYDRLNEEGAYQVLRVGKQPTSAQLTTQISFEEFPSDPINLQQITLTETLTFGSESSSFRDLLLTVSRSPVSKLLSVIINYSDGSTYDYNISRFGYLIFNNRYDSDFAYQLSTLENTQFQLGSQVLEQTDFILPGNADTITISYLALNLGRIINESSIEVYSLINAIREPTPALTNVFSLQHSPIVNSLGETLEKDGVTFLDPQANLPFSSPPESFLTELKFDLAASPKQSGDFAINYSTGQILVYGDSSGLGTGFYPPTATYLYKKIFQNQLDYTYDFETQELVGNPLREIIGEPVIIKFNYEEVLIANQDYVAQVHSESLNERIENRLKSSISLQTKFSPITNVFRIFNETSGELYKIQRWNDNTIFFSSSTSPRINRITQESVSFYSSINEILEITSETLSSSNIRILIGQTLFFPIINAFQDGLGASFSSTVTFDNLDIWISEKYFDDQTLTVTENLERLSAPGEYLIDYVNGTIYLAVTSTQTSNVGNISYQYNKILTQFKHLVAINNLYFQFDEQKLIQEYISFNDQEVIPSTLFRSDERFFQNDLTSPYFIDNGTIELSYNPSEIRSLFDLDDLRDNNNPINFASTTTISGASITLDSSGLLRQENLIVQLLGSDLILQPTFTSDGISLISIDSLLRLSDNLFLAGTISNSHILLDGTNSPAVGEEVQVIYYLQLNSSATPIVEYSKGQFLVDYDYLADEILVSYEYGDNVLDFRQSNILDPGETYYVTYQAGALRDALLNNFGSLINIPILQVFDPNLERERYRDALRGALQMLNRSATIEGIKKLVEFITHIEPELIEGLFEVWSLGFSKLFLTEPTNTSNNNLTFAAGKYDSGLLIDSNSSGFKIPASGNLRLEQGTLEFWTIPNWNGLDNDATLTAQIYQDGYLMSESDIYLGDTSYHPVYDNQGFFTFSKFDTPSTLGLPGSIFTQEGIFIYYDIDLSTWKLYAKHNTSTSTTFTGTIVSSGEVYHVQMLPDLGELNDILRSTRNKIEFTFNLDGYDSLNPDGYFSDGYIMDGYMPGFSFDGIRFMADEEHYFIDIGISDKYNRFSIFKDGRGYLNFRILDQGGQKGEINDRRISTDIQNWKSGELHHIATSWRINNASGRDEMHLFVDGFEVPNILTWGGRPISSGTDRFRTVKPEVILASATRPSRVGNDLHLTSGSNIVFSDNLNFQEIGIESGDTLLITDTALSGNSFTVLSVSDNFLTLNSVMSLTLTDVSFSINPVTVTVSTEINFFNNILVSVISNGEESELPGLRADLPRYQIETNLNNQYILTILGDVDIGDEVVLRTLGRNHQRYRDKVYLWSESPIIRTQLPHPVNLDEVKVTKILFKETYLTPTNSTVVANTFTAIFTDIDLPSNTTEGRNIDFTINNNNVNYATPVQIDIVGSDESGPAAETLTFSSFGTQTALIKYTAITQITVTVVTFIPTKSSISLNVQETYPVTYSNDNESYPVLRFSTQLISGTTLSGDGTSIVTDENVFFLDSYVNQTLIISSPGAVADNYTITQVINETQLVLDPIPPTSFSNGSYIILHSSPGRSGFQNGILTFQEAGTANTLYNLTSGWYQLDQISYLILPWKPLAEDQIFVGTDLHNLKFANAIIDELVILDQQLTDLRIGESAQSGQKYITTDFYRLKARKPDSDTLVLMHLDSEPLKNIADFWVSHSKEFLQTDFSLNDNFDRALLITYKAYELENKGYLTNKSGTIEFWISPMFDTFNDPVIRYYFDAASAIEENVISLTSTLLQISSKASQIIGIYLASDLQKTGTNFADSASLDPLNLTTIKLSQSLPGNSTEVQVIYLSLSQNGNRLSIFKDQFAALNFKVKGDQEDFLVATPIAWESRTWHRVFASYTFNSISQLDSMRLLVDGEEQAVWTFGNGALFGEGQVFGQAGGGELATLQADINVSEVFNQLYIGGDYLNQYPAYARFDNLRLSNSMRSPIMIAGRPHDLNYQSNIENVLPVIEDAFTTFLLNFEKIKYKEDDFALLRNTDMGLFDFTLKVIDSFKLVASSDRVKQILEALIKAYKPARSKAFIEYV